MKNRKNNNFWPLSRGSGLSKAFIRLSTAALALAIFSILTGAGKPPGIASVSAAEEPRTLLTEAAKNGATGGDATATHDELRLKNGDIIFGELESADPVNGVRWRHRDALEPIEFRQQSIGEIYFRGGRPPVTNGIVNCRVQLTNADELEGELAAVDAEKVVLDTWYAGRITLPRKMVSVVYPLGGGSKPIYEGPAGIDGWTLGKVSTAAPNSGQWSYHDGAFSATRAASIARDLNLPDVASIQFDFSWKGMLYVAVAIYTDYLQPINLSTKDTEPDFSGFYSVQLNTYSANLLSVKKKDPLKYLGQAAVPAFSQKNSAHIELRVNKPKKFVALLVDGVLLKVWQETDDFAGEGKGMRFVHQGQGVLKLSNLRIYNWDGQFEERATNPPDSKTDLIKLRNGDKLKGDLLEIRDSQVSATVASAKMTIPIDRVKQIELAGFKSGKPPENETDLKAYFRRGGRVTFQLEKWNAQGVIAVSPNFGKLTINPEAFEWVLFTPLPQSGPENGRSF